MKRWLHLLIVGLLAFSFIVAIPKVSYTQTPPASLVELAQQQYQAGKFAQSLQLLQQAQKKYQNRQENLQQAQVLALISLTQQQLGKWQVAQKAIASGFDLLNTVEDSKNKQQVLAQLWNSHGQIELEIGQFKSALSAWQTAEKLYRQNQDRLGIRGSLINQAEALKNLGFYRRSCNTILQIFQPEKYRCELLTENQLSEVLSITNSSAGTWQITGLVNLANSLLLIGKTSLAQQILEKNIVSPQQIQQLTSLEKNKILLTLGNIYKNLGLEAKEREDFKKQQIFGDRSLAYYQQLEQLNLAEPSLYFEKLQSQLNQLSLLLDLDRDLEFQKLLKKIDLRQNQLIYNKLEIYALINFSRSLIAAKEKNISIDYYWSNITKILTKAWQEAQNIDEKRAQTYALGYLGKLSHEHQIKLQQTPEQLLQQAIAIARSIDAPEISYRWEWELGKMYWANEQTEPAIIAYQAAFNTLQSLRDDLVSLNQEIQFSFRKKIEPVYREFVQLLLNKQSISNQNLHKVLDVIEGLQLAELDNYFHDACLTFTKQNINQIDPNAAVIYTIILPESLEVILALSNQTLFHYSQPIAKTNLEEKIHNLSISLNQPDKLIEGQKLSRQIYQYLIKPFEDRLTINKPKTLVFVLDGVLQNIPMGVLYDGNKYLIEKYAIAVTPGLQLLLPPSSQPINALAAGLSESHQVAKQNFNALNNVKTELENIKSTVKSKTLLNTKFTETNLIKELNSKPFSVLHLATHGQFSSNPNNTFLVLWDRLLKIEDFSSLLQNSDRFGYNNYPLDLLVLSACQTATGDARAALGLAGMSVRTGASSTLASLWQINDEYTTALMTKFYEILSKNPDTNKAETLRLAQLSLWDNSTRDWQMPAFWGAYVLVGNWL